MTADSINVRVLVAGFQHETNTFAPTRADWAAFQTGETFPGFIRGAAMEERVAGANIPAGGFICAAREKGWTVLPSCWAGATPSAHVTQDAFERIADAILSDVRDAIANGGIDAVYLDLHGAAVAEHIDDVEGELLARVREIAGPAIALVASLDMHANVTSRMLDVADALVCYRTYPHVDMALTGQRAAAMLAERLTRGRRDVVQVLRVPFLLPLSAQSTLEEPAASVQSFLLDREEEYGVVLNFATGFPAADIAECGPVIWGYGEAAEAAVLRLHARVALPSSQWRLDLIDARPAVVRALDAGAAATRPVVIADTQDNPGAGGDSNTTGMLHALLAEGAGRRYPQQIALGLLWDPAAARAAHEAGVDAEVMLALGAAVPTFTGELSDPPVRGIFKVRALAEGAVALKGLVKMAPTVELGLCACLEIEGILVAIASAKVQMLDRELFRHVRIEPEQMKLLVVKSSVHFRADFGPISHEILVAKAAGPMAADPAELPWRKLPAAMARHL